MTLSVSGMYARQFLAVLFKRFYKKGYTVSHIFEMINIIPTVCKGPEVIVAILQM
jgi:hypothetical protein